MTNHWNDLANSDCLLIAGCNPAENHPISFKWITKAQEKGAKVIVIDPRFTRSAAKADLYVRLRPGTNIALFGGLINQVLENNLFHRDYVLQYTNAAFVVNQGLRFSRRPLFRLPGRQAGLQPGNLGLRAGRPEKPGHSTPP